MLMLEFRRVACGALAAVAILLTGSPVFGQHHGGGHHGGGNHGGGNHGGGNYGGGNHGGGNHGGHYGGSHYGHGGYSGSNFSLSIGSGLGYGNLGYGAFGYPGPGYGYGGLGGVGYSNYGLGSYGLGLTSGLAIGRFDSANPYSSAYRGNYGSGYSPYYSSGYGSNFYASPSSGYVPTDNYSPSYRYDGTPSQSYGVPGHNSEFSHQPSANYNDGRYSAGRFDETYPDSASSAGNAVGELRPGMVLPDGSRVISVGPANASPEPNAKATETPAEEVAPKRGEL